MTTKMKRPTKEEFFDLFINKNMKKQEIADMYGVSIDVIKNLNKKYNIKKKDYRDTIIKPKQKETLPLFDSVETKKEETVSLSELQETIKKEAERIVNEKLASSGLTSKQEEVIPETNNIETKVDDFFKSLKEEVADTDIPLDWQPTMNVLTRMYESGEDKYEYVKFYKSKGIIVNLSKKKYNKDKELQKIKFNINSSSFNYDVTETNDNFVIKISLV